MPGNRISRPETKAPKRPLKSSCPFAETDRSQQMPPIRGYLPIVGKSLLVADCVVADAVQVEPVSTPNFPANREINREFRQISPLFDIFEAKTQANSKAFGRIPSKNRTGNCFGGTGNSAARTGNFTGQKKCCRIRFSARTPMWMQASLNARRHRCFTTSRLTTGSCFDDRLRQNPKTEHSVAYHQDND